MFHQVKVSANDKDALRLLRWGDGDMDQNLVTYCMTLHLFGGVWSPSCAACAMRRTAEDNRGDFPPSIIEAVRTNLYVDDCLLSATDDQSAVRMVTQLCELLDKGGFYLTKWISNSRAVITNILLQKRDKPVKNLELDVGMTLPVERALGLYWSTEEDRFSIQIKHKDPVCNRRNLLSLMNSVFDPLRIVVPYVLVAKLIFQSKFKLGKGLDE
jgi:hypothetical protein